MVFIIKAVKGKSKFLRIHYVVGTPKIQFTPVSVLTKYQDSKIKIPLSLYTYVCAFLWQKSFVLTFLKQRFLFTKRYARQKSSS